MRHAIALCLALVAATAACNREPSKDKPREVASPPTSSTAGAAAGASDIPPPADVAAPPADAEKTPSGLASRVLKPGSGTRRPEIQDSVTVHYTGWTTDGKMFDSSVKRGQPATFGLRRVIPGWTEGMQLMVEGETRRFWIPGELAYDKSPDPRSPKGMLVFDVELIKIIEGPKPIPAPGDISKPPADAQKTPSGLYSKIVHKGTGKVHPTVDAYVEFHFTSWTPDGKMVDSTIQRGRPLNVQLSKTIPAWREGIPLMVQGEKRLMWVPAELATKVPGSDAPMMVYEVELLSFVEPPKAPADVAGPPKDAERTPSGLASKVLQKGKGTTRPTADSTVEVHYTGWTTDGKMFDSSVVRGKPVKFQLRGVIPGWTEGVQLMVEGEKRRFWIPEELAYKGKPGAPQGMLVFDVELISIVTPAAPATPPAPP